nr:MAG TPA: hypothetical protein [Microviridae sp.]
MDAQQLSIFINCDRLRRSYRLWQCSVFAFVPALGQELTQHHST